MTQKAPLTVTMCEAAFERMQRHCRSRTDVEVCGILLGHTEQDGDTWTSNITDVIEGEHASERGVSVTFTHETWNHVHNVMETITDGSRIIGWFHTHPGFGIFYSSQDAFIQNEFFNEPWMPGIVVDPVADHLGVFHCGPDQIETLSGLTLNENDERRFVSATYRSLPQPRTSTGSRQDSREMQQATNEIKAIKAQVERIMFLLSGILIAQLLVLFAMLIGGGGILDFVRTPTLGNNQQTTQVAEPDNPHEEGHAPNIVQHMGVTSEDENSPSENENSPSENENSSSGD